MSAYRQQIEQAVRATTIQRPFSFTWFGQTSRPPPPNLRALMSASETRHFVLNALQQRLYSDFYLPGGAVARRRERTALPVPDARTFIAGLAAANSGSGTWSSGWSERDRTNDAIAVHHDRLDLTLWLKADDIRQAGEHGVEIRVPPELPAWAPGFWLALGDAPFAGRDEPQVRFYWNLRPDGAALLVEHLTRRLNAAQIPFRLKLLADPARYTRCDAAVLYLPESAIDEALPLIQAVHDQVRSTLKPSVPALTRKLMPGVAMADDPASGESFGTYCCRLLAGALIATHEAGVETLRDRLEMTCTMLTEHGFEPDSPYRRAGRHEPRPAEAAISWQSSQSGVDESASIDRTFLEVAMDIAGQIVREALWHGSRCTWLGMTGDQERGQPVYGTLGPDLYGGSAGIALFLGDVYLTTGDTACRSAALGGIRHALAHARDIAPASIHGLYTGLPGIAIAAARLARTIQDPTLLDDAHDLLHALDRLPSREHDLLSGAAGALIAMLLLQRAVPDEPSIERAVRLGDRLLDGAQRGAGGYSWRSGRRALTGLSHGASGIGVALLELAVATGEDRFLAAARGAFTWERGLFDVEGNWPDLRRVSGPIRRSTLLPFGTSWCHGAPGIALARLRAAELLADATLSAEARVALETTRRWVTVALVSGDDSFCLCHGLAGNADILFDGYAALGDPAYRDAATAVAAAGIRRYALDPHRWPCGTYSGETPGLMLGLAGIGRFYLRLADPKLPSILLPIRCATT